MRLVVHNSVQIHWFIYYPFGLSITVRKNRMIQVALCERTFDNMSSKFCQLMKPFYFRIPKELQKYHKETVKSLADITIFRVSTVLEIREKSGNSDRLSERKSFRTPQVQHDGSFCQNTVPSGNGNLSEVWEKSEKIQGK